MTEIRIMRLPHAAGLALPSYATAGAAGMDLRSAETVTLKAGARALVGTGIAIALPEQLEAQIRPRSGLAVKHGITVLNAPGTIDWDYRGEIKVPLINLGEEDVMITRGERIAQMVFSRVEIGQLVETGRLDETPRGTAGFGSSGRE
jgi:dUTP pyrophosphatase